ncbi:unnamed protein product [Psylliodes chrysocephalus]|uniref:MD-2-related lipid-recognition domain-containing protein n=1 Tax=Psylliodes chrysocephalus TaxID=3402493 RepID=A0A9P0CLE4_9CUCU|nr:unnamed protein product [Psylliodes chrysocephala]
MKFIFVLLSIVAYTSATPVTQCDDENPIQNLTKMIQIEGCDTLPCLLKKDTFLKVSFKFTPVKSVKGLKNHVTANILGSKLPFVGVDGGDACSSIYNESGTKLNNCNLEAGKNYFYKNSFEIFKIYPTLKTVVHWSLVSPDGHDVTCFEVLVKIVP